MDKEKQTAVNKAVGYAEMHKLVLPIKYVGARESVFQAAPGEPIRAGSSCDACGTAIREVHEFQDAASKIFKVGCECVKRFMPAAFHKAVSTEHNRILKEKRHARNKAKHEEIFKAEAPLRAARQAEYEEKEKTRMAQDEEFWYRVRDLIADTFSATLPHPSINRLTLRDYANWALENKAYNSANRALTAYNGAKFK